VSVLTPWQHFRKHDTRACGRLCRRLPGTEWRISIPRQGC
jgi:hypothetical protein